MIPDATHSATIGIRENLNRFATAANRIADPDISEGIGDIMEMKQAQQNIRVNGAVIKVANEMSEYLIDLLV